MALYIVASAKSNSSSWPPYFPRGSFSPGVMTLLAPLQAQLLHYEITMSLIWFYLPTFVGAPHYSVEDAALRFLHHFGPKRGFKISRRRGPETGSHDVTFVTVPIPQPDALSLDLKTRFEHLFQPCDRWPGAYGSKVIAMKKRSKVPFSMIV